MAILDSEQVGLEVPFPPRSMLSDIVHSTTINGDEFQRKDNRASSVVPHEKQVHNMPRGTERRTKFNPASVVSWETQQASFQMPFLPRRMQSDVPENNATGCTEFPRKDHQLSFYNTRDEQVASNGKNRPSGITRRRKFNPASVVTFGIHEAGVQVPFHPRRTASYDSATGRSNIQRKDGKSLCINIGEDLVTCNVEKETQSHCTT